jgi:hypothetical protein
MFAPGRASRTGVRTTVTRRAHAIAAGDAAPDRDGMRWKIVVPILFVVAVAVVVVVLVTGGQSKQEKALAQVCDARADIRKQVSSLRGLTLSTAKDQITQSVSAIASDVSTIADARKDLAADRRDQVQAANDKFAQSVKDTLGSVTSLATLTSAGGNIKQAAQQLGATYQSTYGKIDCSDT